MKVKEIFYSYQAEGKYIGYPTLFIRFSGCNLRCYYCDTKSAIKPWKGKYYDVDELVNKIVSLAKKYKPLLISLTGGEPLLQPELAKFLEKLRPKISQNLKIYLETNASLPKIFKKVIKFVDICAVNLKLPVDDLQNRNTFNEVKKVLRLCRGHRKEFMVKIVVSKNLYSVQSINQLAKFLQKSSIKEVILQPETKSYKSGSKNLFVNLCNVFSKLSKFIPRIYIIPQLHKFVWKIK